MGREKSDDDSYSPEETERRRDAALRRALSTPPRPHSDSRIAKPSKRRRGSPVKGRAVRRKDREA
jgi:hypothetical protein